MSDDRIHDRIDAVDQKLGHIEVAVTKIATTCNVCRPMVLGNGGKSIDKRVTILETVSGLRSKGFWALVALVSTLCGVAVTLAARAMGGG